MNNICILTDSIIQFPSPIFEGREIVFFIDMIIHKSKTELFINNQNKNIHFPKSIFHLDNTDDVPFISSPSVAQISQQIEFLSKKFEVIICLTSSRKLTPFYEMCEKAIGASGFQAKTFLIDSNSIALGQGILCQKLVELIYMNSSLDDILQQIRQESNNIYAIFYINNFSYLSRMNLLPYANAVVAEYKNTKQTFILENGTLYPSEKAKNTKNIVDIFENYTNEFEDIQILSVLQSRPAMSRLTQQFKERINFNNSKLKISEQIITPQVSTLFGPQTTGVFIYEPMFF